jgi:hypothetical protein
MMPHETFRQFSKRIKREARELVKEEQARFSSGLSEKKKA